MGTTFFYSTKKFKCQIIYDELFKTFKTAEQNEMNNEELKQPRDFESLKQKKGFFGVVILK